MPLAPETEAAGVNLSEALFPADDASVFALLDGASSADLVKKLFELQPEYCCLYRGELQPDMAVVAPYLARLQPEHKFTEWILAEGWGVHWGMFVHTHSTMNPLRDHFRQFHSVELPDQRTVLFRYYDPRVLRTFLPVCNPAELATFFGPVKNFVLENESPDSGLRFSLAANGLKTDTFQLKQP